MSLSINIGGLTYEVPDESGMAELLALIEPILPILATLAESQIRMIIDGLLSEDPYLAVKSLRENSTEEEWDTVIADFIDKANEHNAEQVALRKNVTETAVSILVGVLCAII